MKCSSCGAPVKDNAITCPYCGTKVGERKENKNKYSHYIENAFAFQKVIFVIFLIAILIIIIGFISVFAGILS